MLEINYESNIDEKIKALWKFKTISIPAARRSALSSVGFYASNEVRKFIETEGDGSWVESHPLTQLLDRGKDGKWRKKNKYSGAYHKMGKFARYTLNKDATEAQIGFGTFSGKDIDKGKQASFSPILEKIGSQMQKNRTIPVDEDRQQMFGSTRGVLDGQPRDDVSGRDFYPLRKGTTSLNVSGRPVSAPVFQKVNTRAGTLFSEKFYEAITKGYNEI